VAVTLSGENGLANEHFAEHTPNPG
jgi:hypothetical protein